MPSPQSKEGTTRASGTSETDEFAREQADLLRGVRANLTAAHAKLWAYELNLARRGLEDPPIGNARRETMSQLRNVSAELVKQERKLGIQ